LYPQAFRIVGSVRFVADLVLFIEKTLFEDRSFMVCYDGAAASLPPPPVK
jgi:hypothetical protein